MALYRFLFAPVLLAVAVLTTSPRRDAAPAAAHAAAPPVAARLAAAPAHGAPARATRAVSSHPATVR